MLRSSTLLLADAERGIWTKGASGHSCSACRELTSPAGILSPLRPQRLSEPVVFPDFLV